MRFWHKQVSCKICNFEVIDVEEDKPSWSEIPNVAELSQYFVGCQSLGGGPAAALII